MKQKGQHPGPEEGAWGGREQARGRRRCTGHWWALVRFGGAGGVGAACVGNTGAPRQGVNIPEAPLQRGAEMWGRCLSCKVVWFKLGV